MLFCRLVRMLNARRLRGHTRPPAAAGDRDAGRPANPPPRHRDAGAIPDPPPAGGPVGIPPPARDAG